MVTFEKYANQLAAAGLNTLDGIKRFKGTVVDFHHGKSDTSSFTLTDEQGRIGPSF